MGRPRPKGERLPNLSAVVEDPAADRTPIMVPDRYGEGERFVGIATATAVSGTARGRRTPCPCAGRRSATRVGRLLATRAPLRTDLGADPKRILSSWFVVMRRRMGTTFHPQEARRHLGVETRRRCSEPAIRRTTPALSGSFSPPTPLAHRLMTRTASIVRQTAHGSATLVRPSPTRSHRCAANYGRPRLFAGRPWKRTR